MTQEKVTLKITNPPTGGGGGVTDHGALTGLGDDDHTQYQLRSEKAAASGYASLNGSTQIPIAQIPTGTSATTVCIGNDARLSVPTGTGFRHVTSGAEDAATKKVELDNSADVTGTNPVTRGGTGITACGKGDIFVGKSANTLEAEPIGSTDGLVLAVDSTAARGVVWLAMITRLAGSSGAAGPYITWQRLTSNASEITSQTPQTVMTTTGVGAGTWRFRYTLVYQSGDTLTTNGLGVAVNHTGTTGMFVMSSWFITDGGAAATGNADQVAATQAGQLVEGKSERVKNTCSSPTVGVDTAAADCLMVCEGIVVVTVSGSLEFKVRSELAAAATDGISVRANTCLELHKIA